MFNKNLMMSLTVFLIFMIFTSMVKHKTRNFEKEINTLNKEITFLRKELKDAKTDYVYLSSPAQLQKYLLKLNFKDYFSYDISRIFKSTDQFIIFKEKQTKLLQQK